MNTKHLYQLRNTVNVIFPSHFKKRQLIFLFCCFEFYGNVFSQCQLSFLNCPNNIITIVDCDNSGDELIDWPFIISNPNAFCYNFSIIQTFGPTRPAFAPLGQYLIGYQSYAFDINSAALISASCQFSVKIVADTQSPVIANCPPNITINGIVDASGNCTGQAYWQVPTTTDNCSTVTISADHPCGSIFPMGVSTVTYTSTDQSNNITTCSFTVTVNCPVGSPDEIESSPLINIYPNPSHGTLSIDLNGISHSILNVRVISLTGQILFEESLVSNLRFQDIQTSNLKPGMYFLQIVEGDRILSTNKVIIQ